MSEISLNPTVVPYSKGEMRLFKMMPKDGTRVTTQDLVGRKSWGGIEFPRNSLNVTINSLREKVAKNKEAFKIMKTKQRGPHPIEYWIERAAKKSVKPAKPTKTAKAAA